MAKDEERKKNPESISGRRKSRSWYCALEYRGRGWSGSGHKGASVVLIVVADGESGLQFLVHPDWRKIVEAEDLDYIESLLRDFQQRDKLHPDALFKQLSSLGVGPLVIHEEGSTISNSSSLFELRSRFVQLYPRSEPKTPD